MSAVSASEAHTEKRISTVKSAITVTMQLQEGEEVVTVDSLNSVTNTIYFPEPYMYIPNVSVMAENGIFALSVTNITNDSFEYTAVNSAADTLEDTIHWIAKV